MANARRLYDLSLPNYATTHTTSSEELLDIPTYGSSPYIHNTAPNDSFDVTNTLNPQQGYFDCETNELEDELHDIQVGGIDFSVTPTVNQIHYISSKPSLAINNTLDILPRGIGDYPHLNQYYNELFIQNLDSPNTKPRKDAMLMYGSSRDFDDNQQTYRLTEPLSMRQDTDSDYLNEYFNGVKAFDPYVVHLRVIATYKKELEYETRFQNGQFDLEDRPSRKRRRKPNEVDWKPESIFRSYVDCKPMDIQRSSYPDNVPMSSCFGRINMRGAKAWSRQPNKPKRRLTRVDQEFVRTADGEKNESNVMSPILQGDHAREYESIIP